MRKKLERFSEYITRFSTFVVVLSLLCGASSVQGQSTPAPLPITITFIGESEDYSADNQRQPRISADGTVIGTKKVSVPPNNFDRPWRWSPGKAVEMLPFSAYGARGANISDNGKVAIGFDQTIPQSIVWSNGGFTHLACPTPPKNNKTFYPICTLRAVSANGDVIVGKIDGALDGGGGGGGLQFYDLPIVWRSGVYQQLPDLAILPNPNELQNTEAEDLSADGSVIVGTSFYVNPGDSTRILIWKDNYTTGQPLPPPPFPFNALTTRNPKISSNGKFIAGRMIRTFSNPNSAFYDCFRWSESTGYDLLTTLSSGSCRIEDINDDGSRILFTETMWPNETTYIWDPIQGARPLDHFLATEWGLGVQIQGYTVFHGTGISADGTMIVGTALDTNNKRIAWMAGLRPYDLIDPSEKFMDGHKISTEPEKLIQEGREVQGLGADGISQIIVRIGQGSTTPDAKISILDENGNPATSYLEYGSLLTLGAESFGGPVEMNLKPIQTSQGERLLFIYRAPEEFPRMSVPQDLTSGRREVRLKVSYKDGSEQIIPIKIVRPPLVLLHGTFSNPGVWDASTSLNNPEMFTTHRLDFSDIIDNQVSYTNPTVLEENRQAHPIRRNAVGVAFNAPFLLQQLKDLLDKSTSSVGGETIKVATVQADLVAHSLGGLMARGMGRLKNFHDDETFRRGYIHKLITVASTHLGTHHSLRMFDGTNDCTRDAGQDFGSPNLISLKIGEKYYNGAVFDQVGDGTLANASQVIQELHEPLDPFPEGPPRIFTRFITATKGKFNESILVDLFGTAVRRKCNDFLANHYSNDGWDAIFNNTPNDAIVPLASARDGQSMYKNLQLVIHGPGSEGAGSLTDWSLGDIHLGFNGPNILEEASGMPAEVISTLNVPLSDPRFVLIP
jgi:uncharacterized membrane protein